MQQSDLCDCSDAYIIDKGPITAKWGDNRDIKSRSLAFKKQYSIYWLHIKEL